MTTDEREAWSRFLDEQEAQDRDAALEAFRLRQRMYELRKQSIQSVAMYILIGAGVLSLAWLAFRIGVWLGR